MPDHRFIFDNDFVVERKPVIGETVLLTYAKFTNKKPELGIYVGENNNRLKIFTPEKIVYWDSNAPIYVIDNNLV